MKRILVTTDLSVNSKAALRFAIQLASQHDYQLTVYHAYKIMRPTSWKDSMFSSTERNETKIARRELMKFVNSVSRSIGRSPHKILCVAKKDRHIDRSIMDYAAQHNFDYICISRKGHGESMQLFGSTTTNLITRSEVPVITVPASYRRSKIDKIAYASDLMNLEDELKKVLDVSQHLDAKVELLHFKVPMNYLDDEKRFEKLSEELSAHNITPHYENLNYEQTLIANINKTIVSNKPSVMIMFTQQKRTLFEKLFLSSISAEYASMTKIPLLVFKK